MRIGIVAQRHLADKGVERNGILLRFVMAGDQHGAIGIPDLALAMGEEKILGRAGDIFSVPISHGEGRILAEDKLVQELAAKGQILTQYVDENGLPTNDIQFNPNGSTYAIEGLISPDGRVLGKMGHAERIGDGLYQNVAGNYDMKLFKSMVEYFK